MVLVRSKRSNTGATATIAGILDTGPGSAPSRSIRGITGVIIIEAGTSERFGAPYRRAIIADVEFNPEQLLT
jgi:hypothetical protein